MRERNIRVVARCVFRAEGRYLFVVCPADARGFEHLIPVGGGVEFGEYAKDAAVREVREELGLEIEAPVCLGAFEEMFSWGGESAHEIVFCYLFEATSIEEFPETAREADGQEFRLEWPTLEELRKDERPVFPEGLIDAFAASE